MLFISAGCVNVPTGSKQLSADSIILHTNDELSQEIVITDRNLSQLNILVNNEEKKPSKFIITFKLQSEEGNPIAESVVTETIKNRRFIAFKFQTLKDSKNKKFVLKVKSKNKNGKALMVAYINSKDSNLSVNDDMQNNKLLILRQIIKTDAKSVLGSIFLRLQADKIFILLYTVLVIALSVMTILAFVRPLTKGKNE